MSPVPIAILTASDTRPLGEDTSGQALVEMGLAVGRRIAEVEPMSRLTER